MRNDCNSESITAKDDGGQSDAYSFIETADPGVDVYKLQSAGIEVYSAAPSAAGAAGRARRRRRGRRRPRRVTSSGRVRDRQGRRRADVRRSGRGVLVAAIRGRACGRGAAAPHPRVGEPAHDVSEILDARRIAGL